MTGIEQIEAGMFIDEDSANIACTFEYIQRWTFATIPILKLCAFIPVWKIVVSAVSLIAAGASIPTNRKPEQLSRPCPAQYIIHTDHSHQLLNSNADTLA